MDHNEQNQQDGASSQAHTVVGYLDILGREDGGANLV